MAFPASYWKSHGGSMREVLPKVEVWLYSLDCGELREKIAHRDEKSPQITLQNHLDLIYRAFY